MQIYSYLPLSLDTTGYILEMALGKLTFDDPEFEKSMVSFKPGFQTKIVSPEIFYKLISNSKFIKNLNQKSWIFQSALPQPGTGKILYTVLPGIVYINNLAIELHMQKIRSLIYPINLEMRVL